MELTNLIWHLGALIGALWAGFSYRALLLRQQELEGGVLVSLLVPQANSTDAENTRQSQRQLSLLRSARARALAWFVDEFARRHNRDLSWKNRDAVLGLTDEQWRLAISGLFEFLQRPQNLPAAVQQICVLEWQQVAATTGQWAVASEKGNVDVE
jgi:hypothetical protein